LFSPLEIFLTKPRDVINACRSLHSDFVINEPKKTITINTKQERHLRSAPQEIIIVKINGNANSYHPASADHGFGCE
jgi:hypothetical protein